LIGKIPSWLVIGPIFGLIFGLLGELSNERIGGFLGNGLAGMVLGGVIGYILGSFISLIDDNIVPAEAVHFSWLALLKGMYLIFFRRSNIVISMICVIVLGVIAGLREDQLFDLKTGLLSLLGYILLMLFLGGFFGGMSLQMLEKRSLAKPNQGIRNSLRNSVLLGTFSSFSCTLVYTLLSWLNILPIFQHNSPFFMFLGFIPLIALPTGGLACLGHFTLRLLLWSTGLAPMNYPRFLDYAADCILLRKVGGGYIFVHRLLLEYFASLDTTSTF